MNATEIKSDCLHSNETVLSIVDLGLSLKNRMNADKILLRGSRTRPCFCPPKPSSPEISVQPHDLNEPVSVSESQVVVTGKRKILVVEDNVYFCQLLESFLQIGGHETVLADSGERAVELYELLKDEISLVVLDLIMPRMSGQECLMKLIELNPSVKVLVVSVLDPQDGVCMQIRPFVRGFLHKPCRMDAFLEQAQMILVN